MGVDSESGALARARDGFRHRSREGAGREAFVDAAFAFSVTLPVISVDSIQDGMYSLPGIDGSLRRSAA